MVSDVQTTDVNRPGRGDQDAAHHLNGGGFSGTVGADETEDLPFGNQEVQLADRLGLAIIFI